MPKTITIEKEAPVTLRFEIAKDMGAEMVPVVVETDLGKVMEFEVNYTTL